MGVVSFVSVVSLVRVTKKTVHGNMHGHDV